MNPLIRSNKNRSSTSLTSSSSFKKLTSNPMFKFNSKFDGNDYESATRLSPNKNHSSFLSSSSLLPTYREDQSRPKLRPSQVITPSSLNLNMKKFNLSFRVFTNKSGAITLQKKPTNNSSSTRQKRDYNSKVSEETEEFLLNNSTDSSDDHTSDAFITAQSNPNYKFVNLGTVNKDLISKLFVKQPNHQNGKVFQSGQVTNEKPQYQVFDLNQHKVNPNFREIPNQSSQTSQDEINENGSNSHRNFILQNTDQQRKAIQEFISKKFFNHQELRQDKQEQQQAVNGKQKEQYAQEQQVIN